MTLSHDSSPIPSPKDIASGIFPVRKAAIKPVLWLMCILTLAGAIAVLISNFHTGYWYLILLAIIFCAWMVISTFVQSIPYRAQAIGLLAILYLYSTYALVSANPVLDGKILLAGFILAVFFFEGVRAGVYSGILAAVTVLVYSGLTVSSQFNLSSNIASTNLPGLVTTTVFFLISDLAITSITAFFTRNLEIELGRHSLVHADLTAKVDQMESSFQKISSDYQRSEEVINSFDQFASQFASDITPEITIQKAINALKDQFDLYFVGAFEKDERGEFAVLKAGTGQEGNNLVSRNFRLKLSDMGIVSHSFNKAEFQLSPNTREDLNFLQNPLLPSTLSELVIPMVYDEKVIGVIDLQSSKVNAFSPEEIKILHTLTDQIALIYQKANISQQLKKVQGEFETTYKQFTQRAWRTHLRQAKRKFSYRFRANNLEREAPQSKELLKAMADDKPVVVHNETLAGGPTQSTILAVPIRLRGEVIGAMDLKIGAGQIPSDLEPLIETICNRLAVALENARLIEEIQTKADREHRVSEISNQIRSSPNVEKVLRTAAAQIGQTLGASEVLIHLHSDQ
jgi:GAF domain-containing protein